MRHNICKISLAGLILLLMLPIQALALPAISCHCFKDRSFDAGRPAAADPYFLATTQNAFFALVFNVDKKNIVMKKQQGTSSDDLWIAYWIASGSGESPETLLQARQKNKSWKDVPVSLRLTAKTMGSRFSSTRSVNSSSAHLAETVVDELFFRHNLLTEPELSALRKAGVTNQELIIATVIATRMRQPARQIYLEVKSGSRTWGSLLTEAKIDTKNMQQEISSILKLRPQ